MSEKTAKLYAVKQKPDFHGAALIDAQGREIPITEDMIQQACERLEHVWHYPAHERAAHHRAG
ncbi:hypothetical protein K8B33_00295 [Alcanivorax sp. JB21]|uniref:PA1571 family protein n=1 Tax=Alcanivorax limicola TaxID=2874102 RepID=UPI001CC0213F|nr:PA1571 family protein [Alcanivorax limicola]MBZ2187523.1 hypothetical protein [Alcanivorax limicola]